MAMNRFRHVQCASEAGLRGTVAMVGRTLERAWFRIDGDSVRARERARAHMAWAGMSWRTTRRCPNRIEYLTSQRCPLKRSELARGRCGLSPVERV